ncbi:Ig-like domain-containing protein [Treponema sp. Marseille-Q4132]|uniref:Ig-like domain-containing protein n=1 Tax=Treponema sp. Marseille-Q4132 TaxID=2766701 RepID=UPI0016530DFB|nr:Ig-like domain-containing protein [Treponema sp. Marseille-Q4132]QNL98168.1 Ig-like domain-containing protein [Treponema sp. Marseille-Q4132]
MKTSNYARKILTGAALFMLFTGLFTGCPQNIEDKAVSVESVRLDKTELDLGVEESYKLSAAITPANANNKKITWASDNSGIAEVDQNGNVRGKADGTALITVTTEDGGKTAACTVKVKFIHIESITLDKTELNLLSGESSKLTATINPANASNKKITWASDNSGIAEVDQNGNVRGKAVGTAVITVTTEDGGKTAACTVKVKFIHIESITLDKTELNLLSGESSKLTATINPANASNKKITWASDNSGIAEVDQDGNVRGKAEGTAVITATTEDGNKTVSCNVTVEKGAILYLSPDTDEIKIQAQTLSYNKIIVVGCTETEMDGKLGDAIFLHPNGDRVILKGDIDVLHCDKNQLTGLNVQGLNNLKTLGCNKNQLTSLDVQGLNNLEKLFCEQNQLTSLNVQGLNNLKTLYCSVNRLTSLDVQGLNNLETLHCIGNRLTNLDVQGLNSLKFLWCDSNQLTSLNVQGLNNLEDLSCSRNQLTSLNVQGLNNLEDLSCSHNQLTSLNVQGLNNLKELRCNVNKLNRNAFTKLFNDLPKRYNSDNAYCVLYTTEENGSIIGGNYGIIEGNYTGFTTAELKVIKDKKWRPIKYSRGYEEEI